MVYFGFAFDYGTLLASQFLLGAGLSATIPCLPKLVSEWFPQEKAGLATGACMAGFPVGDILALNVTPYLQTFLNDWRQPLQVYGVWTFILVGLWWKFTHGNPEKRNRAESFSKPLKQDLEALFKMKEVWLLTGLYFCASGCFDTALLWLPDILQSKGTSPYAASIIASMLPIGFLVASATVGVFSDKIGLRRPFIMILGLVSGPAIYLTGAVLGPVTYVTVFLAGFCTVGTLTLTLTIPVEMPSISSRESSALGLISAIGNAGSLLLPTIIGQIRDVTGTFLLATLILAITGECIFVLGLALTETGTKGKKHV